jgi:predicted porin
MNKQYAAVAALSLSAFTTLAHSEPYLYKHLALWPEFNPVASEDKITVYGTVDAGMNYVKAGSAKSITSMQSGGDFTSKLGFYGRENLGGGLRVEANLESSIKADTGASGSTFYDRASWVGLKSSQWGTVRLGNQIGAALPLFIDVFGLVTTNSISYWLGSAVVQRSAYTSGITSYGANSDLGNGATQVSTRVPGSFTYTTPRIDGFDVKAIYAPGSHTSTTPGLYNQGAVATYAKGPWFVAASYNQVWGINSTTLAEVRTDLTGIGGVYDTGKLVLSAAFNQSNVNITNGGTANVYTLGVILPMDRHVWRVSMAYRDTDGVRNTSTQKEVDSSALGLMTGYDYELSKHTGLYARAGVLRNFGASTIMLNSAALPTYSGSYNAQTGVTSRTASVGMYYHF